MKKIVGIAIVAVLLVVFGAGMVFAGAGGARQPHRGGEQDDAKTPQNATLKDATLKDETLKDEILHDHRLRRRDNLRVAIAAIMGCHKVPGRRREGQVGAECY